ncbi:MAG TPA: hypothetical protein VKQ73_02850 [Stellaceae bacterium]|nr:hypothetical protein [Stellaceae bacterium]
MQTKARSVTQSLIAAAVATTLSVVPTLSFSGGLFGNITREVGSCLSGGCDVIWHANQRIDDSIASKFRSAADPVKQAVEEASDHVLQDQLLFLDRVDALSVKHEDRIAEILTRAMEEADSDADHIGHDIKNVADDAFDNYHCAITSTFEQAQQFIDNNFRIFGGIRDKLVNLFNKQARSCPAIQPGNFSTVYDNGKCLFDIKMSDQKNWTIEKTMQSYRAFLEFNAMTACTIQNKDVKISVLQSALAYEKRYHLWELALQ